MLHPARLLEQRRESMGACILCGTQIDGTPERKRTSGRGPTRHICRPCLDKKCAAATAIAHRRVEHGLCTRCGILLVNRTVRECAHCRSRERHWYAKRQGKPPPEILPPRPPPRSLPRPPLVAPAGLMPLQLRAEAREDAAGNMDRRLPGHPKRKCSKCGESFAPTCRRRMLCLRCFQGGDTGPMAA